MYQARRGVLSAAISATMLLSSIADAASITLQGTLRSSKPDPVVTLPTGDVVANVKPYFMDVSNTADGCTLTADEAYARSGSRAGHLYCLIEWTTSDAGLSQNDINISGTPVSPGTATHHYTISYFSGSDAQKITITEGDITEEVLAAIPPNLLNVDTRWGANHWQSGFAPVNHDPAAPASEVKVFVDPRNYDQRVDLDLEDSQESACTVAEGEDNCTINISIPLGGNEGDPLVGREELLIAANSANQFYGSTDYSSLLGLGWDYRPPLIDQVVFNATAAQETISTEIDGTIIDIPADEGIVIISSPHSDDEADWWIPTGVDIALTPDPDFTPNEPVKEVDGHTLFLGRSIPYDDQYEATTHGDPVRAGDKLVYSVTLNSVPDGGYSVEAQTQDVYANASESSLGEHLFSRDQLQIKLFDNYEVMSDGAGYVFAEHLLASSYNNFSKGSRITKVTIDGQTMKMTPGEDASVQYLSSAGLNLTPNTRYPVVIEAEDLNGIESTYTQEVTFAPYVYKLEGILDPTYAQLTENRFYLDQEKGDGKCREVASVELAESYGSRDRSACMVEWPVVPHGMYVDERTKGTELLGAIQEVGTHPVSYKMRLFDGEGNNVVVAEYTTNIDVVEAEPPTIYVEGKEPITDTLFVSEIKGGKYGSAQVLSVPAKVEMNALGADGINDYYYWKERRNKNDPSAKQKGTARLYIEPGDLWSTRQVDVSANYQLAPSKPITTAIDVVFVPSTRIRSYLELRDDLMLTTEDIVLAGRVAIYDRKTKSYNYDIETYGEWDLTLEERVSRKEYTVIDGPYRYDGSTDEILFRMDGAEWLGKNKMCIRADLVSPVDGYERMKRSRCINVAVFKGDAIEGKLNGKHLIDRAPMDLVIRYKPESRADDDSMGDVMWQISDSGGSTWTEHPSSERRDDEAHFVFNEAGEWDIRAIVKNKFTDATTITEPLHVIAYNRPDLEIVGQKEAYIGEPNISLQLMDNVTEELADGDIEWSMDDGRTWEAGDSMLRMDTSTAKTFKIKARMRYAETDESIEDGVDVTKFYFKVQMPKKPKIKINEIPKEAEVGTRLIIQGEASQDRLGTDSEWVTPEGQIIPGERLDVVVAPGSLIKNYETRAYVMRSWVKGYKNDTLTQKTVKIKVWQYNIPVPELKFRTRVKYAPAFVDVEVKDPNIYAPTVNLTKDIDFDTDRGSLLERDEDTFKLKLEQPGVYPITGLLRDDRGGSSSFVDFYEVLEPIPMDVAIQVRSYSNKEMKEPLSVYMYADRELSHNQDEVTAIRWYLNGEQQNAEDDLNSIYWNVEDLPAGIHTIKLATESKFGQFAEDSLVVQVQDNIAPECSIEFNQDSASLNFRSMCLDPDGSIKRYEWYMNEDYVGGSDRMRYFKRPHLVDVNSVTVTLRAYDDSFESVEVSKTVHVTH